MYNEYPVVLQTIKEIRKSLKPTYIYCVHSEYEKTDELEEIKTLADGYVVLPNLAEKYSRYEIPSQSICRNYSHGFSNVYANVKDNIEYIVALTGDTLVIDALNFERRYSEMKRDKIVARVMQVVGAKFHGANADPVNGIYKWRRQGINTTDFFPQLFIIDGYFAFINNAFSGIKVTNRWSSEQCLGDEVLKYIDKRDYNYRVTRLNIIGKHNSVFSYKDGIKYQQFERKKEK